jgi:hypothetical protein
MLCNPAGVAFTAATQRRGEKTAKAFACARRELVTQAEACVTCARRLGGLRHFITMFSIGVDLGQRRDYSAVAIVERVRPVERRFDAVRWRWQEEVSADEWVVRHLERMQLGTPYTTVTGRIVELARSSKLRGERRPMVDMLRAGQPGCGIAAVWITWGQGERFDGKVWHVPKLELLARLQTLLESKRLRIAERMREAGTLGRELLDIKSARRASGRLKVGAEGAGEHDDLALAVALAVWVGRRATAGEQGRRLPGI